LGNQQGLAPFGLKNEPARIYQHALIMDQLLAERDWHKASRHMGNEAANHLAAFNFSEKVSVSDALCRKWRKAEQNRRKALAAGLIGSFVCYKKSCKTADKVPLFKSLERKFCSVMASTPIIQ